MNKFVYADNAATTKINSEVLEVMKNSLENDYGNPSSVFYNLGSDAKTKIEDARKTVAEIIGAKPKEIIFTSGGSESDNYAIKGIAHSKRYEGNHIITSKIEHHAVLHSMKTLEKEGFKVTYLDVDEYGLINPIDVEKAICDDTILISIMYANNEIGTIEPIEEIGKIARKHGVIFHTDAVQAIGHEKINVEKENIDMLSLSAHKFGGPKGVGALYIKTGVRPNNLIDGGAQEFSKRSGTENTAGIIALAKALEIANDNLEKNKEYTKKLTDKLICEIPRLIPNVKLNGHKDKRLAGNVNFSFEFIEGEGLLLRLALKGIYASSGSACASASLDPSHVLLAIGMTHEKAHGSLRITLNHENTMEEVDYILEVLPGIVKTLRDMSPLFE